MGNGSRHLLVIVLLILRRRSVGQIAILQMTSRRLCPRWFRIDNLPSIRRTSRAILDSRSEPHLISQHLAHPAPCRSSAKRFGLACLVDAEAYGQTNDPADHRPAPLERDRVTRTLLRRLRVLQLVRAGNDAQVCALLALLDPPGQQVLLAEDGDVAPIVGLARLLFAVVSKLGTGTYIVGSIGHVVLLCQHTLHCWSSPTPDALTTPGALTS